MHNDYRPFHDDVTLDHLGNIFRHSGPEGIQIWNEKTGYMRTKGRYCRVRQEEVTGGYSVEINDVSIHTTSHVAGILLNEMADVGVEDGEFYCTTRHDELDNVWWCYPARGCDVTFYTSNFGEQKFCEFKEYVPDNETLIVTTHRRTTYYVRASAKIYKLRNSFYIGHKKAGMFWNESTEISEDLYEVLKSSNRATKAITEETEALGLIESFSMGAAPVRGRVKFNSQLQFMEIEVAVETDNIVKFSES